MYCSLELVSVPLCLSESAQCSGAREKEGGVWSDEKTENKKNSCAKRIVASIPWFLVQ